MKPVYLDYNATTPLDREVAAAMRPYLEEHFGNPSSTHWYGVQTKTAVERARKQVAGLLGCHSDEIIFTSGGSESNNMAIQGIAFERREKGNHIITTSIEHPAVIEVCRHLESVGFEITYLPVDADGLVSLEDLERSITARTILITVMHANNEVGTIQPIEEISRIAGRHGIAVHTDAAQSVGKIPVRTNELGVDLLSVAGHKIYAPKGIGALFVRRGTELKRLIHGAAHERGMRAGTENVLEIVGLGKACEVAARDLDRAIAHMRAMRDRLYEGLRAELQDVPVNGHPRLRLPNTLSVSFPHVEANMILSEVQEVAVSAGAACHSDTIEISPVLAAMGRHPEQAMGTVRFSTGRKTTAEDIDSAVGFISRAIRRLQPGAVEDSTVEAPGEEIKLTHYTQAWGCACKLRPQALEEVMALLSKPLANPNIIVNAETADDAAVYRINEETAVVQTLDFFMPIVDDPYHFGAIAAANAISDIYAMGAEPVFGLNIVGFPSTRLPLSVLHKILEGAGDKAKEAGVSILGGHTIDDTEPKYGLAVTGVVHPDRIMTNDGAREGDAIILTKPIGTGILSTAMKRGLLGQETTDLMIAVMSRLNRAAADVMKRFTVHACTDVTGFGLLGHLREVSAASGVDVELLASGVPVIPEAMELAASDVVPGGTVNNHSYVAPHVRYDQRIPRHVRMLLCDAQTSGGLLLCVPMEEKDRLLAALHDAGVGDAAYIGRFLERGNGTISVVESAPAVENH